LMCFCCCARQLGLWPPGVLTAARRLKLQCSAWVCGGVGRDRTLMCWIHQHFVDEGHVTAPTLHIAEAAPEAWNASLAAMAPGCRGNPPALLGSPQSQMHKMLQWWQYSWRRQQFTHAAPCSHILSLARAHQQTMSGLLGGRPPSSRPPAHASSHTSGFDSMLCCYPTGNTAYSAQNSTG
jgi:hypothetical protein